MALLALRPVLHNQSNHTVSMSRLTSDLRSAFSLKQFQHTHGNCHAKLALPTTGHGLWIRLERLHRHGISSRQAVTATSGFQSTSQSPKLQASYSFEQCHGNCHIAHAHDEM
ncbi:hypothetical protein V7S43_006918 [Phytophthora oleae]|uniref:Uncharacterized protein n=1 Tax=Phytophthora oleae TaxID=2107226 RepID=A0ABD3FR00_9STRA